MLVSNHGAHFNRGDETVNYGALKEQFKARRAVCGFSDPPGHARAHGHTTFPSIHDAAALLSDKNEMEQLLSDTKSIINSIYEHENKHDGLATALTRDLETIESTLSRSRPRSLPRSNKSFSFDNSTTNDVADLGQKRIESLASARAQFDNSNQVEAANPWRPDHQQSIQRYFEAAATTNQKPAQTLIVDTATNQMPVADTAKVQKSEPSPSIRHSVAIARNKNLSPSLNLTNLASNTKQTESEDDRQLARMEREMNEIQRSIEVEIPLDRYYLKRADFEQGKRDLVDKLNLRLTKKDLGRLFGEGADKERKMDIHEFRQRLAKSDKLTLNNVELTRLDAELKRINDDIHDEAHFGRETLTRFLSSTCDPKPDRVHHGKLRHLDSTLSLYHPSQVQLRTGSDESLLRSAQSEPPEVAAAPIDRRRSFREQHNAHIEFADFTRGASGESAEEMAKQKIHRGAGEQMHEERVSRRGQPQLENWWLRQFYMHGKYKQMNARRRRKGMVRGRHSTDSSIELKALPYSLRLQHRSGRRSARKVSLEQYRGESMPARSTALTGNAHAAGMYPRCRTKCIRTQMWSPARSRSFVCRK